LIVSAPVVKVMVCLVECETNLLLFEFYFNDNYVNMDVTHIIYPIWRTFNEGSIS